ncbi:peptide-methionine (S)-S-oxide reductase MsrA [Nitriliruptoraceae bacterium ZYF776]|nr:peptide-methionine (S)-S-oxide reductase MsrA [Profundirhabdus halotolerans]
MIGNDSGARSTKPAARAAATRAAPAKPSGARRSTGISGVVPAPRAGAHGRRNARAAPRVPRTLAGPARRAPARPTVFGRKSLELLAPEETLPGRDAPVATQEDHHVLGVPIVPPFPDGTRQLVVGMGCFWGAERIYWQLDGVVTTAVGYSGGATPNPTYEEVCTGRTNHAEDVLVVYDPAVIGFDELLVPFWENHDPTQRHRQGNDVGTQYRSQIQVADEVERAAAEASRDQYQTRLHAGGFGEIATEIVDRQPFYWAEPAHQQYLAKNPFGYCNHGFCQVAYADEG